MKRGLSATALKLIAVLAMICDHIAWASDFSFPVSQAMHVVGRLTIPIMCFFIAEGYRHTHNLKKYALRLAAFWLVSVVPFYLFFGDIYGYRQNIIFDLLLALLFLTVTKSEKLPTFAKVLLCTGIVVVSVAVGGWPLLPIIYVLIFYYVRSERTRALLICAATFLMTIMVVGATMLNDVYHFSGYNWVWSEKIYLLGFVLALIPLHFYNGKRGGGKLSGWFFYVVYPLHLLVLYLLEEPSGIDFYGVYIGFHMLTLTFILALIIVISTLKSSRPQTANLMFLVFAATFLLGFIVEITTSDESVLIAAVKFEYFSECGFIMAYTWFIDEFCRVKIPREIYLLEAFVSFAVIAAILTIEENTLFYESIAGDYSGLIPKTVVEPGIMFVIFYIYFVAVFLGAVVICFIKFRKSAGVERRRIGLIMAGSLCPWVPMILKVTGVSKGYDIIAFGIFGALCFFTFTLVRYGYFNSVQAANENALNHGNEGLLVIDSSHSIIYFNKLMGTLFPELMLDGDAYRTGDFGSYFERGQSKVSVGEKIYEMRVEPLVEKNFVQGYMLWAIEMTDHYKLLEKIQERAEMDALTGLYNRRAFETHMDDVLEKHICGAMMMFDMDNLKYVNDHYGHGTGDSVLIMFGRVLREKLGEKDLICRIGGDEYCAFTFDNCSKDQLRAAADEIIADFSAVLVDGYLPTVTTVSIGAVLYGGDENVTFADLYASADKALYASKNGGKNMFSVYEEKTKSKTK